jgi:hypothetical protein
MGIPPAKSLSKKSHRYYTLKAGVSKKKKCLRLFSFSKAYRAVAKSKSAYAAMLPSGTLPMKRQNRLFDTLLEAH